MESELSEINEALQKRKTKIGLVGTRLNVSEIEGNLLSGEITQDWREIAISYGKELNLTPDKGTEEYARKRGIKNPKMKAGEDLLEHEAGHRENKVLEGYGCPHDIQSHDRIKDKITLGLQEIGKSRLEDYVTNAYEDIFDNINCRRHTDFSGQTLFWNNQGAFNTESGKFSPFYEAFLRINLMLGSNVSDYTLLKRFFSFDKKTNKAVNEFLNKLKSAAKEKNSVKLHEKQGFDRLFNPDDKKKRAELWAELGYDFAVNLGPLLKDLPKEKMFGFSENSFDKEMKIPTNKQKIAHERYKEGKGPASYREFQEQLYDLYKAISKEIRIETSHYTASQSMPLVHFGRRFAKEDERKFKFKGVKFKENGELGLRTAKFSIDFPVAFKKHPQRFPKFKLISMDRSGSMGLSPNNTSDVGDKSFIPWGDKSKYHFGLKGYFGIDNFFESQGIAPYIESCVLGYSGESAIRGKSGIVARQLLVEPSGGTSLDIEGLEKELEEQAMVMSISDGEFSINREEKERLTKKLEFCDYAHIQIGDETEYSSFIKQLGKPVITVRGDDDLSNAMVSFVSNHYRKSQTIKGGRK